MKHAIAALAAAGLLLSAADVIAAACGACQPKAQTCAAKQGCAARQGCGSGCGTACAAKATACEAKTEAAKHAYGSVTTEQLQTMVRSEEPVVLVDARSGKYDDGRRIEDAIQLAPSASEEAIGKALPNKEARIVAYCSNTRCPASARLAEKLVELGYKNVHKYPDGIEGWTAASEAVE